MNDFLIVNHIEQGTDEWRSWRKRVIGASDAPTIMGENPWSKPEHLIKEKMGLVQEFRGNDATREGHALEDIARQKASNYLGIHYFPTIIQDSKHAFLAASLDGMSDDGTSILEIKSGAKSHAHTLSTGQIPDYYYAQLQHMLMISEFDSLFYASFRPNEKLIVLEVERDDDYIEVLFQKELDFVNIMKKRGHKVQDKFLGTRIIIQKDGR